jgi:hypothetical protein
MWTMRLLVMRSVDKVFSQNVASSKKASCSKKQISGSYTVDAQHPWNNQTIDTVDAWINATMLTEKVAVLVSTTDYAMPSTQRGSGFTAHATEQPADTFSLPPRAQIWIYI